MKKQTYWCELVIRVPVDATSLEEAIELAVEKAGLSDLNFELMDGQNNWKPSIEEIATHLFGSPHYHKADKPCWVMH